MKTGGCSAVFQRREPLRWFSDDIFSRLLGQLPDVKEFGVTNRLLCSRLGLFVF